MLIIALLVVLAIAGALTLVTLLLVAQSRVMDRIRRGLRNDGTPPNGPATSR